MIIYLMMCFLIIFISANRKGIVALKANNAKKNVMLYYKEINVALLIFTVFLIAVIGFRDFGGADDSAYRLFYENRYGFNRAFSLLTEKEPSFLLIEMLGWFLGLNYKFVFLMYAIITMLIFYNAIKNYELENYQVGLFCLAFFLVVLTSIFTVMRQALAMAVIFYYYSVQHKLSVKGKIFFAILSFLCHYASVFSIFLEVIRHLLKIKKLSWKTKIVVPCVSLLIGLFLDFKLIVGYVTSWLGMYEYMNADGNFISSSTVGVLTILFFICYVVLVVVNRKNECDENFLIAEEMQMLYFSLAFVTIYLYWGSRLQLYYIAFVPFIIVDLFGKLSFKMVRAENVKYAYLFVSLVLVALFVYVLYGNSNLYESSWSLNFWGNI